MDESTGLLLGCLVTSSYPEVRWSLDGCKGRTSAGWGLVLLFVPGCPSF
jgi:hypothetical protein